MGIPSWAMEALVRSVGSVVDKVPPERLDQLKQRAGQWLDELPQTAARSVDNLFRGARAGKERLDQWARRHVALVTPVINATGTLADPRLQGVPLDDHGIDLGVEAAAAPSLRTAVAIERLNRRLNACAGLDDLKVLVTTSIDAACLAVGLSRRGRPLYVHRSQALRLPSGTPIPEAFLPLGAAGQDHVHEVGSIDSISTSDLQHVAPGAIVIAVDNGGLQPLWFATAEAARGDASQQPMRVLVMSACGGLRGAESDRPGTWQAVTTPALRGVREFLGTEHSPNRVDLVIASGAGVLGGPPCGLIIGRRSAIEPICSSQVWTALEANIATKAIMAHTLETLQGPSPELLPVIAMLKTGEENLRSRAQRLATRMSADMSILSCQITDESAKLTPSGPWRIGSRQLRLRRRGKEAIAWAEQLATDVPAVLAEVVDDTLVVDLRWVQPSDDSALAAALLGQTAAEQEPAPSQETHEPTAAATGENDQQATPQEGTD